jgi:23S rRNA (cytosine1962-C5)-methyltransferase
MAPIASSAPNRRRCGPAPGDWDGDGEFVPGADEDGGGRWSYTGPCRARLAAGWGDVRFTALHAVPPSRLLPDMAPVWDWMGRCWRAPMPPRSTCSAIPASARWRSAFGPVTHVDASKKSVAQARANAALSGMEARPIRWIIDDAAKFTAREGVAASAMTASSWTRPSSAAGPRRGLAAGRASARPDRRCRRAAGCRQPLPVPDRLCGAHVLAGHGRAAGRALADLPGTIEHGDLAVREDGAARLLPTAIFARWSNP